MATIQQRELIILLNSRRARTMPTDPTKIQTLVNRNKTHKTGKIRIQINNRLHPNLTVHHLQHKPVLWIFQKIKQPQRFPVHKNILNILILSLITTMDVTD